MKCLRCGKKITGLPFIDSPKIKTRPYYDNILKWDLGIPNATCKKCIDEFVDWWDKGVRDEV